MCKNADNIAYKALMTDECIALRRVFNVKSGKARHYMLDASNPSGTRFKRISKALYQAYQIRRSANSLCSFTKNGKHYTGASYRRVS